MRILHVDSGREMRGGQWQVLYLLRGLAAMGHQVTLLARDGAALLDRSHVEDFDSRPLFFFSLAKLARSHDLVHLHDSRSHTLAALTSAPVTVVARRVAFPVRRSILSRLKYGRGERYIAVSMFVRGVLMEAGIAEHRIAVVHDGVPLAPEPSYENRARVVAIDSADPGKGKALIEEAARRAKIDIVFSRNLNADLAGAALFVYVTDSEGLGSAVLAAMSAGVPVLASRVGGLPEIVEDGVTGRLTENSPEQISDKMLEMTRDPEALERWGRAARKRIEGDFTAEHMTRNTLAVYEQVLG